MEGLVHVGEECLVVFDGEEDVFRLFFAVFAFRLVLETPLYAVLVVFQHALRTLDEGRHVRSRQTPAAEDFHALIEALIHLCQGVYGRLGGQHFKELYYGPLPQLK